MSGLAQPPPLDPAHADDRKTSKLAVVGLVFALIGMCFFPLALVGLVLGIMAMIRIGKNPKQLKGTGFAVASMIAPLPAIATTGIIAAIAIPSFLGYVKRSKTAEAEANVSAIYQGVATYHETQGLPPPVARTPTVTPCGHKQPWPADAPATWAQLGFSPTEPVNYAYEYELEDGGRAFVIRAYGDLDCDGTESLFELRGAIDAQGNVFRESGIYIENELE